MICPHRGQWYLSMDYTPRLVEAWTSPGSDPKQKGRRTKAAHRSPDEGAKWNSDGRRPLRGAAQVAASTFQERCRSGSSFSGEAVLDAHASFGFQPVSSIVGRPSNCGNCRSTISGVN